METTPKKQKLFTNADTFSLLHTMRRYCGFTPFHVYPTDASSHKLSVKVTFVDVLCFLFCMTNCIYFGIKNYTYRILFNMSTTFVTSMGTFLVSICGFLIAVGCPIMNFMNRKRICKLFNMIEAWDVNLYNDLGETLDKEKIKRQARIYLIVGFTSTLILALITIVIFTYITPTFSLVNEWWFLVMYILICAGFFIFITHFIMILQVVVTRYEILNRMLETKTAKKFILKQNPEEIESNIIKISILHNEINAAVELGNKTFSVQMIPFFTTFMCYIIFTAFQLYLLFIKFDKLILIKFCINLPWLVWSMILILMIIRNASKVLDLNQDMAIKIHNTINRLDPIYYSLVVRRLRYFSQQIQHRKPIVSCGLFSIDYSLLFGMAGAFTTFIVILIQFDSTK